MEACLSSKDRSMCPYRAVFVQVKEDIVVVLCCGFFFNSRRYILFDMLKPFSNSFHYHTRRKTITTFNSFQLWVMRLLRRRWHCPLWVIKYGRNIRLRTGSRRFRSFFKNSRSFCTIEVISILWNGWGFLNIVRTKTEYVNKYVIVAKMVIMFQTILHHSIYYFSNRIIANISKVLKRY